MPYYLAEYSDSTRHIPSCNEDKFQGTEQEEDKQILEATFESLNAYLKVVVGDYNLGV